MIGEVTEHTSERNQLGHGETMRSEELEQAFGPSVRRLEVREVMRYGSWVLVQCMVHHDLAHPISITATNLFDGMSDRLSDDSIKKMAVGDNKDPFEDLSGDLLHRLVSFLPL